MITKERELVGYLAEIENSSPFADLDDLSWLIAREFSRFPGASPNDYVDEFDSLCDRLGFDSEEMRLLVASKIEKVKYPPGQAFATAIANAQVKPKRFGIDLEPKSARIANIIYYLSLQYPQQTNFPIPVNKIATTAQTSSSIVYAVIDILKNEGSLKVVNEKFKPHVIGKLYRWVGEPLN